MEIRELAETVLRSSRLSDKLARPETLSDARPGPAIETPTWPGRPSHLRIASSPASFSPKRLTNDLRTDRARGLTLHFFANHELLALELMALVLLRFPDAPSEFRYELAKTLFEEQDHLRMYLERMRELGVDFGDRPVGGAFWRALRDTPSPLAFVAAMSLTFEQANLDHCRQFADRFRDCGDESSARILDAVYEDEIGHVMHGYRWFDRWRPRASTEWEAYEALLPTGVFPADGRSTNFDERARERAGLSEAFRRGVRLSPVRPRPGARLHVLNLDAEERLASNRPPSAGVERLIEDLEPLLLTTVRQSDRVSLRARPPLDWLEHLAQHAVQTPSALIRPKLDNTSGERPGGGDVVRWAQIDDPNARRFLSRSYSVSLREAFLSENSVFGFGPQEDLGAEIIREENELDAARRKLARLGHHVAMAKALFSTSGRRRVRIRLDGPLDRTAADFVRVTLRDQRALVLEPWLDRVRDFGTVLTVSDGATRNLQTYVALNDDKGRYLGHVLGPHLAGLIPAARRALHARSSEDPFRKVARFVGHRLAVDGYRGPAGIDAFLYRRRSGDWALQPLVEVNVRQTMGHLARRLVRRIAPHCAGLVLHVTRRLLLGAGEPSFTDLARSLHRAPELEAGRLTRASLCLAPPERARFVLPLLIVDEDVGACLSVLGPVASVLSELTQDPLLDAHRENSSHSEQTPGSKNGDRGASPCPA